MKITDEEIENIVNKFMLSYGNETFIPNKYGAYIYKSECGTVGINLVSFFKDLVRDALEQKAIEITNETDAIEFVDWLETNYKSQTEELYAQFKSLNT